MIKSDHAVITYLLQAICMLRKEPRLAWGYSTDQTGMWLRTLPDGPKVYRSEAALHSGNLSDDLDEVLVWVREVCGEGGL